MDEPRDQDQRPRLRFPLDWRDVRRGDREKATQDSQISQLTTGNSSGAGGHVKES